jgi:hypothetical protein
MSAAIGYGFDRLRRGASPGYRFGGVALPVACVGAAPLIGVLHLLRASLVPCSGAATSIPETGTEADQGGMEPLKKMMIVRRLTETVR